MRQNGLISNESSSICGEQATTVCCDAAGISKTVLEAFRTRRTSGGVAVCRQCNCMVKATETVGGISTEAELIAPSEGPKSCFG